jgi:hypothetical protein
VALKPISSAMNSFPGHFALSIDRSKLDVVPWRRPDVGRCRYDIVVFHWPDDFFGAAPQKGIFGLLAKMLLDRLTRGTKYIWVFHNIRPHDSIEEKAKLPSYCSSNASAV